jgi:hypothetical protein
VSYLQKSKNLSCFNSWRYYTVYGKGGKPQGKFEIDESAGLDTSYRHANGIRSESDKACDFAGFEPFAFAEHPNEYATALAGCKIAEGCIYSCRHLFSANLI